MWSLWRVHDVFEAGTPARRDGHAGGRARAPCPTARSPPARRSRPSSRCRPWRWPPMPAQVRLAASPDGKESRAGSSTPRRRTGPGVSPLAGEGVPSRTYRQPRLPVLHPRRRRPPGAAPAARLRLRGQRQRCAPHRRRAPTSRTQDPRRAARRSTAACPATWSSAAATPCRSSTTPTSARSSPRPGVQGRRGGDAGRADRDAEPLPAPDRTCLPDGRRRRWSSRRWRPLLRRPGGTLACANPATAACVTCRSPTARRPAQPGAPFADPASASTATATRPPRR